jgi:PAS domain S-box-containing protein
VKGYFAGIMILLFVVGCSVSVTAFLITKQQIVKEIREQFTEDAKERVSSLQFKLNGPEIILSAMVAFFEASDEVTRSDFRHFSQIFIMSDPTIQAMEWIPLVRREDRAAYEFEARNNGFEGFVFTERNAQGELVHAGNRATFFPVYYVEPFAGNEAAFGFDLGSNLTRASTLGRSRNNKTAQATERITLVQDQDKQAGILLVAPVFSLQATPDSVDGQEESLEGYVLLVFKVADLVTGALEPLGWGGLNLMLLDRSASPEKTLLYTNVSEQMTGVSQLTPSNELTFSDQFTFGERVWEVVFTSELKHYKSQLYVTSWLILGGGLLITVLFMFVVQTIGVHRRKEAMHLNLLEDEVNARTLQLHNSLQESESIGAIQKATLDYMADALIVINQDQIVTHINAAAEKLLDLVSDEVTGRSIETEAKLQPFVNQMVETLQTGWDHTLDVNHGIDIETTHRTFQAVCSNIPDKIGKSHGVVLLIRDVTHERDIDSAKSEFVTFTAHELRTPLTSIQGYSDILLTRTDLTTAERSKFLGYINKKSVQLGNLINDLLDISRIEAGQGLVLNLEHCNAGEVLTQVVSHYMKDFKNRGFNLDIESSHCVVNVDKLKMAQVIENVLSNSVKYSADDSNIQINAKIKGNEYEVSISDQGIGMTPEQTDQVFNKFYRADTSNSRVEGTGLGMAISKQIIEAHDGKIWLKSTPNQGTTVFFSLPL